MTQLKETDWETLLRVWMHDPIDKALDIKGHEARARRYTAAALWGDADQPMFPDRDAGLADQLAAISERLPMPTAGIKGERAVGPENRSLRTVHPMSGKQIALVCPSLDEASIINSIDNIVRELDEVPKTRFLALWRMLADQIGFPLNALPADTRVPDHSLIHHADITAGIWASIEDGTSGRAFLSFALGPVQPFIAAARSLRDLWTGSVILSCIAFAAMRPILENLGPTAFVYPTLRGNPLMDMWLREEAGVTNTPKPDNRARRSPSLPHRFLALVPYGNDGAIAKAFADCCKQSAQKEWLELSESVRTMLADKANAEFADWDRRWEQQVEAVFDFHTTVVPERDLDERAMANLLGSESFENVWPEAAKVRSLADAIPGSARPGYDQKSAGRWQAQLDLSARIMEAARMVRHVPVVPPTENAERVPPKCSLLGSFEQIGPADFSTAERFWKDAYKKWRCKGVRLRKGERFSSVALTKRFAMPVYLTSRLGLEENKPFPDTATVAAEDWLRHTGIKWRELDKWNGRWLHESDAALESDGEDRAPSDLLDRLKDACANKRAPPSYYAILMMDGDDLGGWLRGQHMPKVRDVMHPKMRDWFEQIGNPNVKTAFETRRPVGPALHAAISGVLGRFATRTAPKIVEDHAGTLIYSGGDDLLALLPARRAIACARSLRNAYQFGDGPDAPGMGEQATISAGVAFVHYKEDLRLALAAAREAEAHVKNDGKDALALRFMRRSGEHSKALIDWNGSEWFDALICDFAEGASNRWAYRLRAVLPVLSATDMPSELIAAEIRRLGNRSEKFEPAHADGGTEGLGARVSGWWQTYSNTRHRRVKGNQHPNFEEWLSDFTALCQGAAFIARGRDD
ncbi:type III-B CRISPR-associated protein Cas10/Cmr2 [Ruegeria sp.]|uniref:type III-B CRISPR-associated protein Cas10/Cmr2 n=1 Tax=Ruegeria sp. TaxID=1879320 RepID=UPI003C7A7290